MRRTGSAVGPDRRRAAGRAPTAPPPALTSTAGASGAGRGSGRRGRSPCAGRGRSACRRAETSANGNSRASPWTSTRSYRRWARSSHPVVRRRIRLGDQHVTHARPATSAPWLAGEVLEQRQQLGTEGPTAEGEHLGQDARAAGARPEGRAAPGAARPRGSRRPGGRPPSTRVAKSPSPLVTVGSCTSWTPAGAGHGAGRPPLTRVTRCARPARASAMARARRRWPEPSRLWTQNRQRHDRRRSAAGWPRTWAVRLASS